MEQLSTLLGKYGEEGDRLLFKVLNSGDALRDLSDEELLERNAIHFANKACEKGLAMTLPYPSHAMSLCTALILHSPSVATRYSLYGVLIAHRKGAIESSISAMLTSSDRPH